MWRIFNVKLVQLRHLARLIIIWLVSAFLALFLLLIVAVFLLRLYITGFDTLNQCLSVRLLGPFDPQIDLLSRALDVVPQGTLFQNYTRCYILALRKETELDVVVEADLLRWLVLLPFLVEYQVLKSDGIGLFGRKPLRRVLLFDGSNIEKVVILSIY